MCSRIAGGMLRRDMAMPNRRRSASRRASGTHRKRKILIAIIIVAAVIVIIGLYAVMKYAPTSEQADLREYYEITSEEEVMLVVNDVKLTQNAIQSGEAIYLPIDAVNESINSRFYWDGTEGILRYVSGDTVISTSAIDTTEYTRGRSTYETGASIAVSYQDTMYLSLEFIALFTDIHYEMYTDEICRLVISDEWGEIVYNEVTKDTQLRTRGGNKSPVITELSSGTPVTVIEEFEDWVSVMTQDGYSGYIRKAALGDEITQTFESDYTAEEHTHLLKDEPVTMAWHQVTNTTANGYVEEVLADTQGVNVISPTWFYLNDNTGGIASFADSDYVTYCHGQGIEVWALVSNLENTDIDMEQILNVTSNRDQLVSNLISAAIQYDLDGINVDFESLSEESAAGYLEFIRELSVRCAKNDIVLSVDNYVPSSYTQFYDRGEQAQFADYLIIMGYDEHYDGSEAGAVASLSFVETGISETLEEVPAEQLILGIPFYTRLWTISGTLESGGVTSEVYGMSDALSLLDETGVEAAWDEESGCNYAEWIDADGNTKCIWLEDAESIARKLAAAQNVDLAGYSFWKLGYEDSSIWDTIAEYENE